MDKLVELIAQPFHAEWHERAEGALKLLFGSNGGRYSQAAEKAVAVRAPFLAAQNVPFAALIHPGNPSSGGYSGMSWVIFPCADGPALVAMVVGTQGLGDDALTLGRPGHARKAAAICRWLNQTYGRGELLAWAKQQPTRADQPIPDSIAARFPQYRGAFEKYGREIYAFFVPPTEDPRATRAATAAFLDLNFEERGHQPLSGHLTEAEQIRSGYQSFAMPNVQAGTLRELLERRRYVVLEGPPGTGKTRLAQELAAVSYFGRSMSVQFHPSTTYESFVGGLAPITTGSELGLTFSPVPGTLMRAAAEAQKSSDPFLLHIDEINRGDLAKVLGEAIYLLEPSAERPRVVDMPYDFGPPFHRQLSLPPNLHILGTMNSADRSIAILDVVIRRRFAFVKLWPQPEVVTELGGAVMQGAFRSLLSLFLEHAQDDSFGLIPGHSYFLQKDDQEARSHLMVNLVPLLEEYLAQGYVPGFGEEVRGYIQWIESLQS